MSNFMLMLVFIVGGALFMVILGAIQELLAKRKNRRVK